MSDRVVAITGASSGIGAATARLLAQRGWSVALGARRTERIEALAGELRDAGAGAVAIGVDVGDEAQANAFVTQARELLGGLDALVANAGLMLLGPITGASTADWRRMIDANVYGVLYTCHAALPVFAEQGSGHVVIVSSVAGRVASIGAGVYNLTKFGVGAFGESLRQEALNFNTRVTLVEPGAVDTELLSHNPDWIQEQAAQRFGDIERLKAQDIAAAIAYALEQPAHVAINEVLVRPTRQRN